MAGRKRSHPVDAVGDPDSFLEAEIRNLEFVHGTPGPAGEAAHADVVRRANQARETFKERAKKLHEANAPKCDAGASSPKAQSKESAHARRLRNNRRSANGITVYDKVLEAESFAAIKKGKEKNEVLEAELNARKEKLELEKVKQERMLARIKELEAKLRKTGDVSDDSARSKEKRQGAGKDDETLDAATLLPDAEYYADVGRQIGMTSTGNNGFLGDTTMEIQTSDVFPMDEKNRTNVSTSHDSKPNNAADVRNETYMGSERFLSALDEDEQYKQSFPMVFTQDEHQDSPKDEKNSSGNIGSEMKDVKLEDNDRDDDMEGDMELEDSDRDDDIEGDVKLEDNAHDDDMDEEVKKSSQSSDLSDSPRTVVETPFEPQSKKPRVQSQESLDLDLPMPDPVLMEDTMANFDLLSFEDNINVTTNNERDDVPQHVQLRRSGMLCPALFGGSQDIIRYGAPLPDSSQEK